jgi:chromosome segregation ATPase
MCCVFNVCVIAIKTASVVGTNSAGCPMLKKLQSGDEVMEIFQRHYAELRREHSEYEDTVHKLQREIAGLQGRIDQLEELNKRLTEERDQFLERYYRLVTQFELIGGGVDRARAGVSDTIGLLRRRPEHNEARELPSLPPAKALSDANGQLEDGIAKITATLGGEHRPAAE